MEEVHTQVNLIESKYLEAVLFAAAKPLDMATLQAVFEVETAILSASMERLEADLREAERGIRLRQTGAGYELVSSLDTSTYVGRIRRKEEKLSSAAMETLAVIAFKQPVTKSEVEEIRGVNSERVIKQLQEKELIVELGRKDTIGRPVLYGTTDKFLRSVGIDSLQDLQQGIGE